MLTTRIIPCLDVKDGRVVKGVRFQSLRDAGSPEKRAVEYEAQGADELVVLDVSATAEGRLTRLETIRRIRRCISIPLTVGGGVRAVEDVAALLDAGADRVSVNTAAVLSPQLINTLSKCFGRQCIVLAIDAGQTTRRSWQVVIHSGRERTGMDAVAWAKTGEERGAGEILLTSWDRDGTRSGYDLDLIRAVSRRVNMPIIASGGAARPTDLVEAARSGASAVLAASVFHDANCSVSNIKREFSSAQLKVRI
ncbi:MAG: imidazole glycerol phosphate synthase subunit HisF [Phycisphaerales bacterium]|nr:imidazole glycerol phosphate synthase subunit HisF [Phycisphaerales bacterium]